MNGIYLSVVLVIVTVTYAVLYLESSPSYVVSPTLTSMDVYLQL